MFTWTQANTVPTHIQSLPKTQTNKSAHETHIYIYIYLLRWDNCMCLDIPNTYPSYENCVVLPLDCCKWFNKVVWYCTPKLLLGQSLKFSTFAHMRIWLQTWYFLWLCALRACARREIIQVHCALRGQCLNNYKLKLWMMQGVYTSTSEYKQCVMCSMI